MNSRVCAHGNGLAPRDGPHFRCPRPHRWSDASSFSSRAFFRSPAPPLLGGRRDWKLPLDDNCLDAVLDSVSMCLLCSLYFWRPFHDEGKSMLLLLFLSYIFNSLPLFLLCNDSQKTCCFACMLFCLCWRV